MENQQQFRFQVNLSGMITILSNHLYSSPKVYVRELLQNATDAITARKHLDPTYSGQVFVELSGSKEQPTMMIEDNGIGLTEADIHQFLAVIGHSSKIDSDFLSTETSFIGRFGIGLLSCFMVSNEIVVLTQSIHGGPSMKWCGKPDGTYTIQQLDSQLAIGTKIFLRCKPDFEKYFAFEEVKSLLQYYGILLPYPVSLRSQQQQAIINAERPLWINQPELANSRKPEVLAFGQQMMAENFKDFIPLTTQNGSTGGIAYILPYSVNLNVKRSHKVFLKHMLVSDSADNILPDWAFFVKCVIWTDELQPTASRENFYEDEKLQLVRGELGEAIRHALTQMSLYEPARLQHIMELHSLSINALATEDPKFLASIYQWLTFESTYGNLALQELIKEDQTLYYTNTADEYKQIANVAQAQSLLVINGGYVYHAEILEKLRLQFPKLRIERLEPEDISLAFTNISLDERNKYYQVIRLADNTLQRFRCQIQLQRFLPSEVPSLFTHTKDSSTLRQLENAKESNSGLMSSILGNIEKKFQDSAYSTLYLNLNNPMIEQVFSKLNMNMLPTIFEVLYCNALMMGHYPMNRQEITALNQGIMQFISWGISLETGNGGNSN
ncbi:HSP90 family protein [Paenibacillus albiflavus]|uniref:HSP90 family protein n=1 Tax=Paenibacillus albiflavus TaxID=2545760 RepID=UPI0038B2A421